MNEDIASKIQDLKSQMYEIQVEVLPDGVLPVKAHAEDAGFDVFATSDFTVWPGQVVKHPLNIKMKIPAAAYVSIETKSGLGIKGLLVYAGVIDSGYRGVVHAVMSNLRTRDSDGNLLDTNQAKIMIKKGMKIAQFIPFPFSTVYYVKQVESVDADTSRGAGGFGSSGV